MWQEISPNPLTGLSPQCNFIMFVVTESWGVLGWRRGEEGKAPIKKFMRLVLHLPISCADAAGEYLRQTAYLSTYNGAIYAPSHHILLPTTIVNCTNARTSQQISCNAPTALMWGQNDMRLSSSCGFFHPFFFYWVAFFRLSVLMFWPHFPTKLH